MFSLVINPLKTGTFCDKFSLLDQMYKVCVTGLFALSSRSYICDSGKDGKPDSWFLFDSYKRKRNPVTKVQEPVPEMSHISPQTYIILHKNAEKHLLV